MAPMIRLPQAPSLSLVYCYYDSLFAVFLCFQLDFRTGSVEDVVAWATSKGLHEKTIDALQRELVDGEALLTLTKDELTRHPYNIPGGPAASLALAIDGLKKQRGIW